nr:uncharacterized protein LOC113808024 [Penaeus vannamei]
MFARCSSEEKMPRAVFMSCANRRGVCEVRIGSTHNLRAIFIPDYNSTDVDSHVRWNSWFEVPLPGQDRDACDGEINCPVVAGEVTRFTYVLDIQEFWPRRSDPPSTERGLEGARPLRHSQRRNGMVTSPLWLLKVMDQSLKLIRVLFKSLWPRVDAPCIWEGGKIR